tara:strand:+ start:468 stop:605 length:138 start_codon:yes stop_codon:yes gene_type:complete
MRWIDLTLYGQAVEDMRYVYEQYQEMLQKQRDVLIKKIKEDELRK